MDAPPKAPLRRISHWAAELVLVFLGAYAAFWLTNYQQHRADVRRHDQILGWLEERMQRGLRNTTADVQQHDQVAAKFHRALAAGEMPPVTPSSFSTDYSASDMSSLLQSGGYEVLDIRTLAAVHDLESVIRWGLDRMTHYQQLSDELIWPNLDQDISFFLRSGDQATAKTICPVSRHTRRHGQVLSRLGKIEARVTDSDSSGTAKALTFLV